MAAANNIFVYIGGDQVVPDEITHAIIDPSVNIVRRQAFANRRQLVSVIFHDGVEIVEDEAFQNCRSLPRIKLTGVKEIGYGAFLDCFNLSNVALGDKLETIGVQAFCGCSLMNIKLQSIRTVKELAFGHCRKLTEAEFGIDLERIGFNTFYNCPKLQRIAIPLKSNLFVHEPIQNRYMQFDECTNLTTVDIVGAEAIHKTISSLLLKSWRDEMNDEIDRINRQLPRTHPYNKADAIRQWIRSVINRMDHYKAEHNKLLKEHMVNLELAVWKAKLDERDDDSTQKVQATKRAKIDEESSRKEKRITSGADIIIKNVLPFLKLG